MTNKPMLSVERDSIALDALKADRQFIANGIELGFISMPEPETPDPAHDTLPMIDRAIAELKAAKHQGEPVAKYAETVPKFKFETLVEHCKRLERQLYELRAECNDMALYKENAVWFWQHDGADYLQSLSCPVVIPASQLRELLEGKAQHSPIAEQPAPVADTRQDKEDMLYDCAYRNGVMFGYGIGINGTEDDYQKCINRLQDQIVEARRDLKAKPAPVSMVMPERKTKADYSGYIEQFQSEAAGLYNSALDDVARLNGVKP